MKIIKTLFLISLFNLMVVSSIVLAFKGNKKEPTTVKMVTTTAPIVTTAMTIPTIDSRCTITVDGVKYDISQYQSQHSGGNIFQCGTDMSNVFHGQHSNRYLKQMQQYRI